MKKLRHLSAVLLALAMFFSLMTVSGAAAAEGTVPEREESVTVGDLDGIPGVSSDDAIYLLQYVLMPAEFPVSQDVDFNRDGEVDEMDAIYLLNHVLWPNLYPLGGEPNGEIRGTVASAVDRTHYIENAMIQIRENASLELIRTAYSDVRGEYSATVPADTYKVRISADGYIPFESLETVAAGQTIYLETYLLVEGNEDDNLTGNIGGMITNSVTGLGIDGVSLTVRKGWNMLSGDVVATAQTSENGYYSVADLPLGNYTVSMERHGFVPGHFNVAVTQGTNNNCHGVMTPDNESEVELGDMRIILTWGETPRDLDSHLWGPTSDGEGLYHISYRNMSYYENDINKAYLDVDDTSSYGPETTTIYDMDSNGTYSFYVHDYTNRSASESTEMSNSGAQVKVYMGETLIAQYNIPTSRIGTVWHVFDFNATTGTIASVNTFSNVSDPDEVGYPANSTMAVLPPAKDEKEKY